MTGLELTLKGLHELDEFLKKHPDVPRPTYSPSIYFSVNVETAEQLVDLTKNFPKLIKHEYTSTYTLSAEFSGNVRLDLDILREEVCEKIVTKQLVKVQKPVAFEEVEEEQKIVTWKCPESLLKDVK